MKKLIEFAVKNKVTVLMLVCGILLLGKISYDELGIDLLPNMNNPRLYVEIVVGERPPEEIEKNFVSNMESMIIRQSDVTGVSSVIKAGTAKITVDYVWKKDMDEAYLDLQKALGGYATNTDINEFNITQNDPNSDPVMMIALSHNNIDDMALLRKAADSYIKNEIVRIDGVADVMLTGDEQKNLIITTDNYQLKAFNLNVSDIVSKIQERNTSVSGGKITDNGRQYIVKGASGISTEKDFESIIVGYKAIDSVAESTSTLVSQIKAPIYLGEVAEIEFVNNDPTSIVRINGKRCIGLSVFKEVKYNTVKVVDNIQGGLTKISKALPGYDFKIVSNQGTFINQSISEVKSTLIIGIILAVFVLFLFLRRIGTTLIVSIAIPISIVATFNLMFFGGLTLNIMTLGGMALGAGMLVDNAIVVIESIFRNQRPGVSVEDAAINGTADVATAVTASTLTTIVVFLPIVYMHGASGELFKEMAWTVTFALVSSLFVAILVIPMLYCKLAGKVASPKLEGNSSKSLEFGWYENILRTIVRKRKTVLATAFGFFAVTILLSGLLESEFMPRPEGKSFEVNLKLEEGTSIEMTSSTVENIEGVIKNIVGEDNCILYTNIGDSKNKSSVFEGDNSGKIKVILTEDAPEAKYIIDNLNQYIDGIQGMEVIYSQEDNSLSSLFGSESSPIVVEIKGEDLDVITALTEEAKNRMCAIENLNNVISSIEDGAPEVNINIDRVFCGINNITLSTIVGQISQNLSGAEAGKMEYEGEMRDIVIKTPKVELVELENTQITSGNKTYRLSDLAQFEVSRAPREIIRKNQTRVGKITSDFTKQSSLEAEAKNIEATLSQMSLPVGYSYNISGEEEMRKESMTSLMFALILSIVLVYMVLASQFESLLHPFTILLTIPLAVAGAVMMFITTGTTVNIMGVIGIVMLVGIAVNNSIILVDRINQLKDSMTLEDAIVEAGKQRIRPILMTTLTTILALLPLAIGIGEGAELRAPMAVAVIGGLLTSTVMSLAVIPSLYYVFESMKNRFKTEKSSAQ